MIDYKTDGIVTTIILNRPEKRNALNGKLLSALKDNLDRAATSRVVVLRGAGTVFCAGLDLTEALDESHIHETARLIATVLKTLHALPAVTVAAVQGAAIAGGAGLVAACDIVIAEEKAIFGYPEVRRGLIPAQILALLVQQMKQKDLRELLLLGENISAKKAKEMGLVSRVVSESNFESEIATVIVQVLKGAPETMKEIKHLIDAMSGKSFEESFEAGFNMHLKMRYTKEAQEGIRAFTERRKPSWEI